LIKVIEIIETALKKKVGLKTSAIRSGSLLLFYLSFMAKLSIALMSGLKIEKYY